jgi:hypothetical protein
MKTTIKKTANSVRSKTAKSVTTAVTSVSVAQEQPVLTPNQSAPDLDGLELLDREDLIAMVKRMVNGGVSLSVGFHAELSRLGR